MTSNPASPRRWHDAVDSGVGEDSLGFQVVAFVIFAPPRSVSVALIALHAKIATRGAPDPEPSARRYDGATNLGSGPHGRGEVTVASCYQGLRVGVGVDGRKPLTSTSNGSVPTPCTR